MPSDNAVIEQRVVALEGGGGGGGSVLVQQASLVTPEGNDATGTVGNLGKPFKTIQAACNVIPQGDDSTTVRTSWLILVAPGTYDEDVVINGTRRKIALLGLGPWNLGTFGASNWNASGTARNITWNVGLGNVDSVRHTLTIGSMMAPGEGCSTHVSYGTGPRISGKIIVNDTVVGGTTKELYVQAQAFDLAATGRSIDYASGTGILNFYCWRSRFATAISGTASKPRLQVADRTRFDGLIDVAVYSAIRYCQIGAGMTTAGAAPDIEPSGITNTNFAGVFTGPAGSLRLDGSTNYWFKANGATLAGGATKVMQDDLVA